MKIGKVNSLPLTPPHQKINMCIQLEILDTSSSNSPPHSGKVQILPPPPTFVKFPILYADTSQMSMSCRGERDLEALNWSAHHNSMGQRVTNGGSHDNFLRKNRI